MPGQVMPFEASGYQITTRFFPKKDIANDIYGFLLLPDPLVVCSF